MHSSTMLERAFVLSASGECRDVADLERRLKREGYDGVAAHPAGKSLRRQLSEAIRRSAAR